MKWPPLYNKIFLESGNLLATHSGERMSAGQDQDESVQNTGSASPDQEGSFSDEERRLEPWLKWFEEVNFDHLWTA
jgi:hypothetical protein